MSFKITKADTSGVVSGTYATIRSGTPSVGLYLATDIEQLFFYTGIASMGDNGWITVG